MNVIERLFIKFYMTLKRFSRLLIQADESKTYGEIAEKAYGINLGRFNLLLYDTTTRFPRITTYPSESPQAEFSLTARKKLDAGISNYIPGVKGCVFPHVQYKRCRSIYAKVRQPFE